MSEDCDEVKYCFYCGKLPVNPVKLNCKHKCCAECLKEYTKTEKNCPICDTPLPFVIQKADEAEIEGKLEEEPTNEKETNNENEPKYPEIEKAEEIFDFEDQQRKYDEDTNIPGPIKVFAINDEPQKNEENAKNNERPQIRVIPIDEKDANNNPTIGERPQIIDTPIIGQNNEEQPEPIRVSPIDENEQQPTYSPPPADNVADAPNQMNQEEEDDSTWKCPICFDELHDPVVTPCGHLFCRRCIEEWLLRSDVCPMCNHHGIRVENLISIQGQGVPEDRPEADNTMKANSPVKKLCKFVKNTVLTKAFLIKVICFFFLVFSFFVQ